MKLVIGGAYQGKLEYARQTYRIKEGWIDGRECAFGEIAGCRGIHHFHEYIRRMLDDREDGVKWEPAGETDVSPGVCRDGAAEPFEESSPVSDIWFRTDDLTALEEEAEAFASWLFLHNPAVIVVTNELGYGIVPMEKRDRAWREVVGRVCTCLAARSEEVVRVVCGIGMRLK